MTLVVAGRPTVRTLTIDLLLSNLITLVGTVPSVTIVGILCCCSVLMKV